EVGNRRVSRPWPHPERSAKRDECRTRCVPGNLRGTAVELAGPMAGDAAVNVHRVLDLSADLVQAWRGNPRMDTGPTILASYDCLCTERCPAVLSASGR